MQTQEELKTAELVESITVALLSVRNAKGQRVPVPDPMRYARYIANDIRASRSAKSSEARA